MVYLLTKYYILHMHHKNKHNVTHLGINHPNVVALQLAVLHQHTQVLCTFWQRLAIEVEAAVCQSYYLRKTNHR